MAAEHANGAAAPPKRHGARLIRHVRRLGLSEGHSMKRMVVLAVMAFAFFDSPAAISLLFQAEGAAKNDIIAFFQKAETVAQNPPQETNLRIVCQKPQDQGYVTFIGTADANVRR